MHSQPRHRRESPWFPGAPTPPGFLRSLARSPAAAAAGLQETPREQRWLHRELVPGSSAFLRKDPREPLLLVPSQGRAGLRVPLRFLMKLGFRLLGPAALHLLPSTLLLVQCKGSHLPVRCLRGNRPLAWGHVGSSQGCIHQADVHDVGTGQSPSSVIALGFCFNSWDDFDLPYLIFTSSSFCLFILQPCFLPGLAPLHSSCCVAVTLLAPPPPASLPSQLRLQP